MVDLNQIEGRGGASFSFLGSQQLSHAYLLAGGASRDQQFDDFWSVSVALNGSISSQKLHLSEKDGFSARHGMTSCSFKGSVYIFGGQDVEKGEVYNDLFIFCDNKLSHVEFDINDSLPAARHSHTMVAND